MTSSLSPAPPAPTAAVPSRKQGMTWNKDANMTPTTGGTTWDPPPFRRRRRRRRRRASDLEYSVADVSYCSPTGTSLCHHHSPSRRPIPVDGRRAPGHHSPGSQRGIRGGTAMPGPPPPPPPPPLTEPAVCRTGLNNIYHGPSGAPGTNAELEFRCHPRQRTRLDPQRHA